MKRTVPIVGENMPVFMSGALSESTVHQQEFSARIAGLLNKPQVFFYNSGVAALLCLLNALKKGSPRNEVILPAYTAASLVVAICKAGLKPVLCDISLRDFNMDYDQAVSRVSDKTLCLLAVHMFGIASESVVGLPERFPGITVIEDCAQAFGSTVDGKRSGSFCETGFFSFNRGKNLPTMGGGCVVTGQKEVAQLLKNGADLLPSVKAAEKVKIFLKQGAFSLVIRPGAYALVGSLLSRFKENAPPEDIEVKTYTDYQAKLGLALLEKSDRSLEKRYWNGKRLLDALRLTPGLSLPEVTDRMRPAFSRLPIIFEDIETRERVEKRLHETGIESSRMYLRPLHHFFDLGYARDAFPNACFLAERLLTLPVHPLVEANDLAVMADIINGKG